MIPAANLPDETGRAPLRNYAFLHGGAQGSWVWDETLAALKRQAGGTLGGVLALDVPGCGTKRDRETDGIDNIGIANELVGEIERAGLSDVILVGHSQAGQVLPFMAKLRPGLFRRLVHVSCSIPSPGQNLLQMMGTGRHGANDQEVGYPFDPGAVSPAEGFALMFGSDMRAEQLTEFGAKLGQDNWPVRSYAFDAWTIDLPSMVPTTYVICLRDNILPVAWQERFADRLGAERRVHIDAGHQVMNTRPHALAEALIEEAV